MKEIEKKELIQPALIVNGVKKRARKVRNHRFEFKRRPSEAINIDALKAGCEKAMLKHMRSIESAYLSLQPVSLTVYDNGLESSSYMLFSDEQIQLEVPKL